MISKLKRVEPAAAFRGILVPLDFSPSALGAYAVALALSWRQEVELILLHVLDLRTFAAMEKLGVRVPSDKLKMIRHRVRLSFRELIGSSKAKDAPDLARRRAIYGNHERGARRESGSHRDWNIWRMYR